MLFIVPIVVGESWTQTEEKFNLYDVFVNNVFGSIPLAAIGVAVIIALIAFICQMSPTSLGIIEFMYLTAFGAGYMGALVFIPIFLLAFMYFAVGVFRFFKIVSID